MHTTRLDNPTMESVIAHYNQSIDHLQGRQQLLRRRGDAMFSQAWTGEAAQTHADEHHIICHNFQRVIDHLTEIRDGLQGALTLFCGQDAANAATITMQAQPLHP